jgi:hypothetical protein
MDARKLSSALMSPFDEEAAGLAASVVTVTLPLSSVVVIVAKPSALIVVTVPGCSDEDEG